MSGFIVDSSGSRFVFFAPSRVNRPGEAGKSVNVCPFCPENDRLNRELLSIVESGGKWKVRVIANKYPISDFHEVIIHSPEHDLDVPEFGQAAMEAVLRVYHQRFNYHTRADHGQVVIFYNHNVHAGASLKHSHSQLVVIAHGAKINFLSKQPIKNLVLRTKHFNLYCPEFSQWPYELWVSPVVQSQKFKTQRSTFGEISDGEITELTELIPRISKIIVTKFMENEALHKHADQNDVPFNYYIYPGEDWFLRFIPRLIHPGGFELATGMNVNIVEPSRAAEEYRNEFEI